MNFEKFFKEALKPVPAKIEATADENNESCIKCDGRPMELVPLSISIAIRMIDLVPSLTIDDYCKLLKKASEMKSKRKNISKEQKDVEDEIIKKIFESVFK